MERFGELRLLAFTKHIEIERPSSVSPQHTIALEFPMCVYKKMYPLGKAIWLQSFSLFACVSGYYVLYYYFRSSKYSTRGVHVEFPIHFRYQAPSESELYRAASIVAPELFLYCPGPVTGEDKENFQASAWGDIHNESYFQVRKINVVPIYSLVPKEPLILSH